MPGVRSEEREPWGPLWGASVPQRRPPGKNPPETNVVQKYLGFSARRHGSTYIDPWVNGVKRVTHFLIRVISVTMLARTDSAMGKRYGKRKRITPTQVSRKRQFGKYRSYRRRALPIGRFKIIRWSSAAANNSHLEIVGNDTIFSGSATTVFKLNDVNGFTELVNLFDNYRISRVLYRFVITRNPDQATAAGNKGIYPRLVWTHDFNDQVPITRDAIYQRSNLKEFYFGDNKQITPWYSIKPACLIQLYESATSTAYGPKWRQFMDTADNAAPHYGIKYAWDQCFAGVTIRMEAKLVMDCKGVS